MHSSFFDIILIKILNLNFGIMIFGNFSRGWNFSVIKLICLIFFHRNLGQEFLEFVSFSNFSRDQLKHANQNLNPDPHITN